MTISFIINKNKVKTEMIDFSVVWYEKRMKGMQYKSRQT